MHNPKACKKHENGKNLAIYITSRDEWFDKIKPELELKTKNDAFGIESRLHNDLCIFVKRSKQFILRVG